MLYALDGDVRVQVLHDVGNLRKIRYVSETQWTNDDLDNASHE